MTIRFHRAGVASLTLLYAMLALIFSSPRAQAAWSVAPVEVHGTAAYCPLVSVCDDGRSGAIVVWQENTVAGGWLRANHLLSSGDADPAWNGPALVCDRDAKRLSAGALSDAGGGAYVWWTEGNQLFLTRIEANGQVAPGWVARGRNVAALAFEFNRPLVLPDGAGGVYIGWLSVPPVLISGWQASVRVMRVGPDGIAAGGWPSSGRTFGLDTDLFPTVTSFGMDVLADGGLWLAWHAPSRIMGTYMLGDVRVLRTTPSGLPASGWTSAGVLLAAYDPRAINSHDLSYFPAQHQLAVASDGGEGAYVVSSEGDASSPATFHQTLWHLDGTGASMGGWPSTGADLGDYGGPGEDPGASASVRALADGRGGVYVGRPSFGTESTAMFGFARLDAAGGTLPGGLVADQSGIEYALRDDGGMFVAACKVSGASGPFDSDAYIRVEQSAPGTGFFESKPSLNALRYGDVGLAATGDGGAIFAWSQSIDRQGVYAIRLNPEGQVTGVPPGTTTRSTHIWFARGAGVRMTGEAGPMTLALHDLTGRQVARGESAGAGEWTVPGTAGLPSGIYFAKAVVSGRESRARVVVIR